MGLGSFLKKAHDPFGHQKKVKKELGRAAKKVGLDDMLAFEKNNLSYWWDAIREDPERLLMPIFGADPIQSKVFGEILGKDYEPMLNQLGGPSKGAYVDAAKKGIDVGPSAGAHQVAAAIASWYAGGALAAAAPAAVPLTTAQGAAVVGAGAGAIDEELDPIDSIDLGGLESQYAVPGTFRVPNVPGFAEGGDVESAPWPDSTKAEDAAYALATQMIDMEFEGNIVKQGGPQLQGVVEADRATLLPVGTYNVQGIYRPPGGKDIMEAGRYDLIADKLRAKGLEGPEEDSVAAVGAANANDQVWSHEFSHRRDEQRGGGSETYNLIHDAFRSDTPFEWADAVSRWRSWNRDAFAKDDDINTYEDVENHLKKAIELRKDSLISTEVEAREGQDAVPVKRDGWFNPESLRRDQEEQMKRRSHSWSIKKYNEIVEGWK